MKEISNDLKRLRRMGFVKADRKKRVCKLGQWGDVCNRGYQYTFYVSEQGKSYLKWMNKIKPTEDSERSELMNRIAACLPLDLQKAILTYYLSKALHRYKGPSRRSDFLGDLALTNSVLSGAPATLEVENRRLAEENQKLGSEVERLPTELSNYEDKIKGDYEGRIKEVDRKWIKKEEELNVELERMRATIDTLSHGQGILGRAYRELSELHFDSQSFQWRALRIFAPRKEYAEILELACNFERSALNCITVHALCDALDNSQVSTG